MEPGVLYGTDAATAPGAEGSMSTEGLSYREWYDCNRLYQVYLAWLAYWQAQAAKAAGEGRR